MKKQFNHSITVHLKVIEKSFKKAINQALEPYDLTKAQTDILYFLSHSDNEFVIQKDIENHFHISNATVTGLLNRMEAKGLIIRIDNPKDRRTKYIKQTQKAIEIHNTIEKKIQLNEEKIMSGFSIEEEELLLNMLGRIVDNLSKKEEIHG